MTSFAARRTVVLLAICSGLVQALIATRTFGTNDIHYWIEFTRAAGDLGPIDLYSVEGTLAPYNHGPVTSLYLWLLASIDVPEQSLPLALRLPSCVAAAATAVVAFDLAATTRGLRHAFVVAVGLCIAPTAITVAAFHGNSDPVLVLLCALAAISIDRGHFARSALYVALAVSLKPVAIVVLVPLICLSLRQGGDKVFRFILGGLTVFAAAWMPTLALNGRDFLSSYLGYQGIPLRQWGVSQFLNLAGMPWTQVQSFGDHASIPIAIMTTTAVSILCWRVKGATGACALLGLPLLLVLSPAFSHQYLVWPLVAAAALGSLRTFTLFVSTSSIYLLVVYSGWSQAAPGFWYEARATPIPEIVVPLAVFVWITLTLSLLSSCSKTLLPSPLTTPDSFGAAHVRQSSKDRRGRGCLQRGNNITRHSGSDSPGIPIALD